MQFLFRSLLKTRECHQYQRQRSLVDLAGIKHVRDRGLDHAVEREKHLRPMLNTKNLIKQEPSKSLPLSILSQQKDALKIPIRAIDFIRKYPSVFEEFLPGGIGIHPHIKLTKQVLELDSEELLVYQSESYKKDAADRLLKLLMILRINKIPLKLLDVIKWDLGLPQDYTKSIVPEFPDYFRVVGAKNFSSGSDLDLELELVCWSDELAISFMEKKATSGGAVYERGMPIAFPMQFSKGFQVDKKLKKWFDDWQKLPYFSPYENATHLGPSTDESDKWAVGVLHELLNLFVSKKVERDTLLQLGEWLGIRSRFKRALLHHPGIFYLSSKIGTYTVVLREAYKRGLLLGKNPAADMNNQYIHLMHVHVGDGKANSLTGGSPQQKKMADKSKGQGEEEEDEEYSADGYEHDDEEEEEEEEAERNSHAHKNAPTGRGRADKKKNLDVMGRSRNHRRERSVVKQHEKTKDKVPLRNSRRERSVDMHHGKTMDKVPSKVSSRRQMLKRHNLSGSLLERSTSPREKKTET